SPTRRSAASATTSCSPAWPSKAGSRGPRASTSCSIVRPASCSCGRAPRASRGWRSPRCSESPTGRSPRRCSATSCTSATPTTGDDLVSALIQAEEAGDHLDDTECRNLVLNVLVGGVDTTQSQLAHGLRLFAMHPEQWELLGREPERAAAAVSEIVRLEPITPFTARIMREDLEVKGVTFPEGTIVMVA